MSTETVQPVQANNRTAIVDILRGWAILGVVIGNYTDYTFIGKPFVIKPDVVSNTLQFVNQFFFAAKSWTMLSLLFGYGFAVVMDKMKQQGKNPLTFFSKRMFWLLVIALVNSAFWFGDILKDYALLGFLLMLCHNISGKKALICAIILLVMLPFIQAWVAYALPYDYMGAVTKQVLPTLYGSSFTDVFIAQLKGTYYLQIILPQYAISVHVMMFACMLLGLAAQRIDFFNNLSVFKKKIKTTFYIAWITTIVLAVLLTIAGDLKLFTYMRPRYWLIFATMISILTGICWLYTNEKLKLFFDGLQAMGKMTLSNYMAQNIIAVFIFLNVGLGLFNTMPFWFYFTAAVVVFILQIFLSKWWLSKFNYGPVEWIWRQLSYGKRLPLKKQ